jgi:protein tyrosine phosphatase (PTP) superfamily phosphohydrolase (DUF442 family)
MLWRQQCTVLCLLAACIATASDEPEVKARSRTSANHVMARKITLVGVGNFAEVTPHLYRGGQPKRTGYEHLKEIGIDIVVDVRLSGRDRERQNVTKAGMQFVSLPWHCLFPKDRVFAKFLALLRENPGKKIFVHCRYGDDRTGMMIAAYRMVDEGWTAKEAREEMEKFGFHRMVCPSLGPYEKTFSSRWKDSAAFQELRLHSARESR